MRWLRWLDDKKVGYIVRIKSNTQVNGRAARLHGTTRKTGKRAAEKRTEVWGLAVFFASKNITARGRRDERLHVISNRFSGRDALAIYRQRWGIEQLFGHLKKRGFDLEATHITEASKLDKLFAVVSLAFLYSYAWGCHLRASRGRTKATQRKSLFRPGLEGILRLLGNPHLKASERNEFIEWLKSPVFTSIFVV
jgi:transposase